MNGAQQYASNILYHFVGSKRPNNHKENFDVLCKILQSMRVGNHDVPCRITIDYDRPIENGELLVQTVVCFCDIPLTQLPHVHAKKYGHFGVGVDKTLFARYGGRPVIYMPLDRQPGAGIGNYLGRELLGAHRGLNEHFLRDALPSRSRTVGSAPSTPEQAADLAASLLARDVLAFLKYYDPTLPDDHNENFYMEREWRKYGNLELHMGLRQVVVPPSFGSELRERFPRLNAEIIEL
jgi:hypothetical protein